MRYPQPVSGSPKLSQQHRAGPRLPAAGKQASWLQIGLRPRRFVPFPALPRAPA